QSTIIAPVDGSIGPTPPAPPTPASALELAMVEPAPPLPPPTPESALELAMVEPAPPLPPPPTPLVDDVVLPTGTQVPPSQTSSRSQVDVTGLHMPLALHW